MSLLWLYYMKIGVDLDIVMYMRIYIGEKLLICEICGKMFSEFFNLFKYRRIYNFKGLYKCEFCGWDFYR